VVLKLALLESHIDKYATALIVNLRNATSSLINIDAKHSPWPCLTCVTYYILSSLNVSQINQKVLFIKSVSIFSINKVTVLLKLTLLASNMATTLIEILRKTSECDVTFDKQRHQTLHVTSVTCSMLSLLNV